MTTGSFQSDLLLKTIPASIPEVKNSENDAGWKTAQIKAKSTIKNSTRSQASSSYDLNHITPESIAKNTVTYGTNSTRSRDISFLLITIVSAERETE
ncbi:hypothetical protein HY439_00695 [Candidatus Microgenomates bacterium]|nr:hypothetical protein [Candidatus Microgenomates bacterium]